MGQVTIHVDAGKPVVARLEFDGVARYSAYLFAPQGAPPAQKWVPVRMLVEEASSIDARPDVLTFDPAPAGHQVLLFLTAHMTGVVVPFDVKAHATIAQGGAEKGSAVEAMHVDAGYANVVVRVLLVSS